jgi:hypothetical protein
MADVQNYGIKGVGNDVKLGKQGPRVIVSGSDVLFRNTTDSAYVNVSGLDPTAPQHFATKSYVDAIATGLDVKASVRAKTTGNIADLLTGAPNVVDGVSLAINDRILVTEQTTGAQNGIYVVVTVGTGADGVWARSSDADSSAEVTAGLFTFIEEGTLYADQGWVLTTNNPITLGTTALSFTQFSSSGAQDPLYRQQVLGTGASQNVGAVVPADAKVQRVKLTITTPYSVGGNIAINDGTNTYMSNSEIDAQIAGTYISDMLTTTAVASTQLLATITGAPGAGAAVVHVDYTID